MDSPVLERALVMQMVNGLTDKFDYIINVIKHKSSFPPFTEARSMLIGEEDRLNKQVKPSMLHQHTASSPAILYTTYTDNSRSPHLQNNISGGGRNNNRGRGRQNNHNTWPQPQFSALSPYPQQHHQHAYSQPATPGPQSLLGADPFWPTGILRVYRE